MTKHFIPANEAERLVAVRSLLSPANGSTPELDALTSFAQSIFGNAFSAVNIVDEDWLRIAAQSGIYISGCSRELSLCTRVVYSGEILVVPDLREDALFNTLPYVVGEPHLRFYAGAPIALEPGMPVGAFCLMDTKPRNFSQDECNRLIEFAKLASALLRLQKNNHVLIQGEKVLKTAAMTDPMTGFYNRSALPAMVDGALKDALSTGRPFGALYLDMDGFKGINDTYGHQAGDDILREAASRIRALIRSDDIPVRMGGDEFAIFFPNYPDVDAMRLIAERLVTAFRRPFVIGDSIVVAHLSVGAACAPDAGEDRDALLESVDKALYQAKAEGRNRFVILSPKGRS